MTSFHPDIEIVAGDDLVVSGTLTDIGGGPLDLTGASLAWVLVDPNGAVAASFPGVAELVILDPPTSGHGWAVARAAAGAQLGAVGA